MKLTWKIFFATLVMAMLTFSIGGYFLIVVVFQSAFDRERNTAVDENKTLRSYFAAMMSWELTEDQARIMTTHALKSVAAHFANPMLSIRLSDRNKNVIAQHGDFDFDRIDPGLLPDNTLFYETWRDESRYYIQTVSFMEMTDGERLYVETIRDVTSVFADRHNVFSFYRKLVLVMLFINGSVILLITAWAISPLKKLAKTTRAIAEGKYEERAFIETRDEVGLLARDFNGMAERLETKIRELETTTISQRDFIGSVAHEIKTPLTSIIGYADMLRSKKMSEETNVLAADYIFNEGKRMEALARKLLDLLVVKNRNFNMKPAQIKELLYRVEQTMRPILVQDGVSLRIAADDALLQIEPDLMQSLFVNLIDNARKAIQPQREDGEIRVSGQRMEDGKYRFAVEDNGKGIPEQELTRITEIFYTVDKSRLRGSGVGIGLALCKEIVELHAGEMKIESLLNRGTRVSIEFKGGMGD